MLASSSLHHISTREPSHIAHEYPISNFHSNSQSSPNLNLALCGARPSIDAVPRPFFELAPSRYQPAPAPSAPTRALSGLPDVHAPLGGTKHPLASSDNGPTARRGSIVRSYSQSYPSQHSQHPAHHHSEPFVPAHSPASAPVSTHDDPDSTQEQLAGPYLPSQQAPPASVPETMTNHHLHYPTTYEQDYIRAPSVPPAYNTDDRRVSVSSAGSYEHAYPYGGYAQPRPYQHQPAPTRATPPVMARSGGPLTPYDYPVESSWVGRRPSAEQSPIPQQRAFEDYHQEDQVVSMISQQGLGYPQLGHQSPMQSLGSSSSNSTGMPASPDQLAIQPNGLVAALPEGATPPSATHPGQRTYAFVSLAGSTMRKRPRRRYDEIERLYSCSFEDCTKAYGTLNHLNAHVTMQKHGPKRNPSEFKELRKLWRTQKKAEQQQAANRPRGRRRAEDDHPHALNRTASGSYSSPGPYGSEESDDGGTPQPADSQHYQHGQVDQMWSQMGHEMSGRYDGHPGMQGYEHGHDPHGHAMGMVMAAEEGAMDRIPPDATLLQSLPPTHPSQQQQYSNSMHHSMASYGGMPAMSGNPAGPPLMRRASEQSYDYPPPRSSGPPGQPGPHGPHSGYGR